VNLVRVDQTEGEIKEFVDYWVPLVDKVNVVMQITPENQIVKPNKFINEILSTKRIFCAEAFLYIGILWDGSIALCCHISPALSSGIKANASNKTILSIWRGQEYKRLRQKMIRGDVSTIPACRKCEAWTQQYIKVKSRRDNYIVTQGGTAERYYPK